MKNFFHRRHDQNGFLALPLPSRQPLLGSGPAQLWHQPKNSRFIQAIRRIERKQLIIALSATVAIASILLALSFFLPGSLKFSVVTDNCRFNPMVFPRLSKHVPSERFDIQPSGGFSISGYPIVSTQTCVKAAQAPLGENVETARISLLHIPFLQKKLAIQPAVAPVAEALFAGGEEVSAAGLLHFRLNSADNVFSYHLTAGDHTADCGLSGSRLDCSLKPLELVQGKTYALSLNRVFNSQPSGKVLAVSITTLDPVVIAASSISEGTTVFDSPEEIVLDTNKSLAETGTFSLLTQDGKSLSLTAAIDQTTIKLRLPHPLARSTSYTLKADGLIAIDGSLQDTAYELRFTTSGGPKVAGSSIGASRVPLNSGIILTFDVDLKAGQDLSRFISLEINGQAVPATVYGNGRQAVIRLASNLPRCTSFRVTVKPGLISHYDIGDGEAWSLNSRSLCQVVSSIGTSVAGRSILAYRFGEGSSRIILVGGMHGNERSSVATMNAFIDYLEDHAGEIPGHRSIIIIPNSNPDGYAANSRTNTNNVDLNRNFPADNWQSSVQLPGGITLPEGGGLNPLDQPESSVLAAFISQQNPRLVLTYHAVAGVVISNDVGDSTGFAQKYATDSGYRFTTDADSDNEFGYVTTGEFENWLADAKNIPALLVELRGMSSNQFASHRTALINLVKSP